MRSVADISQFEALMNSANKSKNRNAVFNDGGYWDWDGWHSYSEVPPVDPDDGWNYLRRTDPELFTKHELVSPDDGKNWLRLGDLDRFKAEELVHQIKDLEKKRDKYKQDKRKAETQKEIDEKVSELISYTERGTIPYSKEEAKELTKKNNPEIYQESMWEQNDD